MRHRLVAPTSQFGRKVGLRSRIATPRATVLWELRSRTGQPLTCVLQSVAAGRWLLQLSTGDTELHREQFSVPADALALAAFLEDDFLQTGWAEVFRQDPVS